jgi:5,10-methylenetetrahydromethanopterin reductase
MVARHVDSAGHEIVAYNVASADDDPAVARSRVRNALVVAGEPDWQPHASMPDFASELAELRRSTGSPAALAAAPPDGWVDRLAIVGTPERAREQLAALRHSGADRVVLSPACPELGASLDSLAQILGQ